MRRRTPASAWGALALGPLAVALSLVVAIEKAPLPGDPAVARRIQDSSVIEALAPAVNALGDWRWAPLLVVAVLVVITAARRGRPAFHGAVDRIIPFVAVAVLWPGSALLKEAVRSPRPRGADGLSIDRFRSDYGFPSGHVYGDVLTYGYIAIVAASVLPRWAALPVQAACGAIILLAGTARVSVGAHWPSDALGGYLWGALALALVLLLRDRMTGARLGGQGRAS